MKRTYIILGILVLSVILAGCSSPGKINSLKHECIETCIYAMTNKINTIENPAEYPKTIMEIESRKVINRDFCIMHSKNPDPKQAVKNLKEKLKECEEFLQFPDMIPLPTYGEPLEKPLEVVTFPCETAADEEYFLFKERDTLDTIDDKKIVCGKPVEVLQRVCVRDWPHMYTFSEMNLIRQGDLEGWTMRESISCGELDCEKPPRSLCDAYPEVYNS